MNSPAHARFLSWPQLVAVQFMLTLRNRRWMELIGGAIGLQAIALLVVAIVDRMNEADPMIGDGWARLRTTELQQIDAGAWMLGLVVLAAMWAAFLWRDEAPSQRRYHWSLPADRGTHDLARVAAGAIWIVILAVLVLLAAAIWLPYGRMPTSPRFIVVLLAAYGLGSIAALNTERPGLWILGTIAVTGALTFALSISNVDFDFLQDAGLIALFKRRGLAPLGWLTVATLGLAFVTRQRASHPPLPLRRPSIAEPK